jgi:hypothetical protein
MFASYKVIAIDDSPAYLQQITEALKVSGIPCMPVVFPGEVHDFDATKVPHVRLVFSDLHLIENGIARSKANYDAIGTFLDKLIPDGGGPLLLVLWTRYPEEADGLRDHLRERYDPAKQPIAVLPLDKNNFGGEDLRLLPKAVSGLLDGMPSVRAVIHWERDISEAADQCARSLYKLARSSGEDIQQGLELLLSELALAATGRKIAKESPGESVHEALLPLLADQISNLSSNQANRDLWRAALPTAAAGSRIETSEARAAAINSSLHIAGRDLRLTGSVRGAVIPVGDDLLGALFEKASDDLLTDFCVPKGAPVTWRAIQVEASCDYAQQKSPTIPFVLALEAPTTLKFTEKAMRPASIWFSPVLQSPEGEAFHLVANVKFAFSLPPANAKARVADYRLRESLISEVGFSKSQHAIRPGSITLGGKP